MFTFDSSIETGNRLIDGEHKQLIEEINKMLASCVQGKASIEAKNALNFLRQYIAQHFSHEESLQVQYRYPNYERHKHLHDSYKESVHRLEEEFFQVGPTPTMINKLNNNIGGWLINHIKKEDKDLAAHIRAQTHMSS